MNRKIFIFFFVLITVIAIPALITYLFRKSEPDGLNVFSDLDNYIIGVVAAEMPVYFDEEALKAQAVAARTYAIYNDYYDNNNKNTLENIGQAFVDVEQRKKIWGDKFQENEMKIQRAVYETQKEILVYEGDAIDAVFHSMSAGVTESGKDAWNTDFAYLQSVNSEFDEDLGGFVTENTFPVSYIEEQCIKARDDFVFVPYSISIKERSNAGYVLKIQIGNQEFSGSEVRSIFGLRSSNFQISEKNGEITFLVKGFGHGAGMSQHGANEMAKKGYSYKEILTHYYTGVNFSLID